METRELQSYRTTSAGEEGSEGTSRGQGTRILAWGQVAQGPEFPLSKLYPDGDWGALRWAERAQG